jgi:hypothetical protein
MIRLVFKEISGQKAAHRANGKKSVEFVTRFTVRPGALRFNVPVKLASRTTIGSVGAEINIGAVQ